LAAARQFSFPQAVVDGMARESGIVFLAREALFLRGGNDDSIMHQAGGAVVIEGGDAENVHGWSLKMSTTMKGKGPIPADATLEAQWPGKEQKEKS